MFVGYILLMNGYEERIAFDSWIDAMAYADNNAYYTGKDICIYEESMKIFAVRPWYDEPYDAACDDSKNPIIFGQSGYYGDWQTRSDIN